MTQPEQGGSFPPPPPGTGPPPGQWGPPAPSLPPAYYVYQDAAGHPPQFGPPPRPAYRAPGTNGLAIVALVAAFIVWPLGLFLGVRALRQIRQIPQGGMEMAIIAIVVSCAAAIASIVLVVMRSRHGG
jgi:peptidyl-prolyl cis-trans isomerase B (cyclophilin B)